MKKKFALLMAVIMTFLSGISAFAQGSSVLDSVIAQAAGYSSEERKSLIENLAVFSGAEENLEIVCRQIDEQNGMVYSMIQPMIERLGADCVKATLRSIVSFGCEDVQNGLYAYADAKVKPEPMTLSAQEKAAMGVLKAALSEANSNIAKMFEEDGINESVLAYMTVSFLKNVKKAELFSYERGGAGFAVYSVSDSFTESFDSTWANVDMDGETVTADKLLGTLVVLLNTYTNAAEGYQLAQGLSEMGLCKIKSGSTNGGGGGTAPGGSVEKGEVTPPQSEMTIQYEQADSFEGLTDELRENGVLLRVGVKTESGIDSEKVFERQTLLTFALTGQNLMMYRFENGTLAPVKYTAQTEDGFAALLSSGGEYVVKDMPFCFDDVSGWSKPYVEGLKLRGIISGKTEDSFAPNDGITREEFVKLVVELFGMNDEDAVCDFDDAAPGSWYYSYVASAASKGLINGVGDGKFGVGQKIKRQDMAKIICGVLEKQGVRAQQTAEVFADDSAIADYAKESVLAMRSLGIISGDENGNFNPNQFASRQEAAKMISQMLGVYIRNAGK